MNVDELNLPGAVTERLRAAGLHTVSAVLDAGEDGLQAIDGIGPKTASDVLEAAKSAGNGDSAHERDAPVENDPDTQQADAAPDGNGAVAPDANALVTVRNVADAMLLVGERYLLPGQTRTVRRRLIRHIAPQKLEIR